VNRDDEQPTELLKFKTPIMKNVPEPLDVEDYTGAFAD
jgi:hypothetical protein